MAPPTRSGFTLVELMVALTLTAVAAGVAGSTMMAARRTGERVEAHTQDNEADIRLRAVLTDMLRHAPPGEAASEPLLQLRREADGVVLEFLTTGVQAPLGTGPMWRATLWTDSTGLRLHAVPLRDASTTAEITLTVPQASALEVEVLELFREGDPAAWRADWPVFQTRPSAVRLSWRHNGETREPLVVALHPLVADGSTP